MARLIGPGEGLPQGNGGMLREQEAGARTEEVCRRHGISTTTFHKWKARYGASRYPRRAG
jgi:putative transposase